MKPQKTSNRLSMAEIAQLSRNLKTEMDYLEWARIIDSLERAIADSRKTIEINSLFLKQAIIEQERHKCPSNLNREMEEDKTKGEEKDKGGV